MFLRIPTGKNHHQIKLQRLQKVRIWAFGIASTLYKRFLNWNKISKKNKVVTCKTPFFVIGPFCAHHFTCLNIGLAWYGNDAFSILVISTKNWNSSFLKNVLFFIKSVSNLIKAYVRYFLPKFYFSLNDSP